MPDSRLDWLELRTLVLLHKCMHAQDSFRLSFGVIVQPRLKQEATEWISRRYQEDDSSCEINKTCKDLTSQ